MPRAGAGMPSLPGLSVRGSQQTLALRDRSHQETSSLMRRSARRLVSGQSLNTRNQGTGLTGASGSAERSRTQRARGGQSAASGIRGVCYLTASAQERELGGYRLSLSEELMLG